MSAETRERRRERVSPAASVYQKVGQVNFTARRSHLPIRSRTEMRTISGRPSWPQCTATLLASASIFAAVAIFLALLMWGFR